VGELTQAIATVGRGVTKARALSPQQARDAMTVILAGKADPFELGAFLVAMRIKEETAEELTAFVQAAAPFMNEVPGPPPALVIPSYAGKRQTFPVVLASACVMAACGLRVGLHGHATPVDRMALADVLASLGVDAKAGPEAAAGHLARAGVAYVGIEAFFPVMHSMLELRHRMGLRSCFHTMARLVNPFGASDQMVGISHERTFDKYGHACHALGYRRVVAFRGLEGEAEPNPLTPTEGLLLDPDGAVTPFPIDPRALGLPKAGRADLMVDDSVAGAARVREVLAGQGPWIAREAAALGAAVGLYSAGLVDGLEAGMARARRAVRDQEGLEVLALWAGR
jgi:anthranilate phosphoribosyltransferase